MALTKDDYLSMLQGLLPPGKAWNRDADSDLTSLLDGLAEEFARIDKRCDDLVNEFQPLKTSELITEWEDLCGLPDDCTGELDTIQERRNAIVGVVIAVGGQSKAYFEEVASNLGFEVEIEECMPFTTDGRSAVGDLLTSSDEWMHTFIVNAPETTVTYFSVDSSAVGESLASWGSDLLECRINKLKPAHTHAIFAYNL